MIDYSEILVIGAGHQAMAMAGHLSLSGEKIYLWNRTEENIRTLISNKEIVCNGIISGIGKIQKASSDIAEVIKNIIMITTPASSHDDIAKILAPHVTEETIIILNPGRTFGAINFRDKLLQAGCRSIPHIAETQTIVYTCRREEHCSSTIYAMKKQVDIASIGEDDIQFIFSQIPECLRKYFVIAESTLYTSFSNVGMILHCAPVLMNIGWIENATVDFKYYYDGISRTVASYLENLDSERIAVAKSYDCDVKTIVGWMCDSYGVEGKTLFEAIQNNNYYREIDAPQSMTHRYIHEDIPCGLVPIEYAAKRKNIVTPYITTIIDFANLVCGKDFRKIGRICDV